MRVVGGSVTVMLSDGRGCEEKVMLSALMFSYAGPSQRVPSCSLQVSREKAELLGLQLRASHRTPSSRPQDAVLPPTALLPLRELTLFLSVQVVWSGLS